LASDKNPQAAEYVVRAICNLVVERSASISIMGTPHALSGLSRILLNKENEALQPLAAQTFANLAPEPQNRLQVAIYQGILLGLTKLLKKDSLSCKLPAGGALAHLSRTQETGIIIAGLALEALVDLFKYDGDQNLQMIAVTTLANVSRAPETGYFVATHPRVLRGVGRLLHLHSIPIAQVQAARADDSKYCKVR
jgi:hypothetical protein